MGTTNFAKENENRMKAWSVMVYLAGGRDVSDEARESLFRMKQVGSTKNIHLIAQFDSGSEGKFTRRYYLSPFRNAIGTESLLRQACSEARASNNSAVGGYCYHRLSDVLSSESEGWSEDHRTRVPQRKAVTKETIELLKSNQREFKRSILNEVLDEDIDPDEGNQGNTNAGDPKVLLDFIDWATRKYPATKTMVVIWGHGSGLSVAWDFPGSPMSGGPDSISARELTKAFTLPKRPGLASKIRQWKGISSKIDIVGFNSCSLGTIEVYHQLQGLAGFGVASEGFTPKTSWPYDKILKALDDRPDIEPDEFTQTIVREYIGHYRESVEADEQRRMAQRRFARPRLATSLDFDKGPDLNIDKGPDLNFDKGPDLNFDKGPDLNFDKGPDLAVQGQLGRRGIDLSVCDLNATADVANAMKSLVDFLLSALKPLKSSLETAEESAKAAEAEVSYKAEAKAALVRHDDAKMSAIFRTAEDSRRAGITQAIEAEALTRNHGPQARLFFGAILSAHAVSQSYFNKDFTDLHDFCRALKGFYPSEEIRERCGRVMSAIKDMCPAPQSVGDIVKNSKGVSIYFPWDDWEETDSRYNEANFQVP